MPPADELRRRADARLEEALERDALVDPREYLRERLDLLKRSDARAFDRARRYFEEELVPRVAYPGSDAIDEWVAYGALLAELTAPGPLLAIDPSGRARPHARPAPRDHLVLHLPDDPAIPALPISAPRSATRAQRATWTLLVEARVG